MVPLRGANVAFFYFFLFYLYNARGYVVTKKKSIRAYIAARKARALLLV